MNSDAKKCLASFWDTSFSRRAVQFHLCNSTSSTIFITKDKTSTDETYILQKTCWILIVLPFLKLTASPKAPENWETWEGTSSLGADIDVIPTHQFDTNPRHLPQWNPSLSSPTERIVDLPRPTPRRRVFGSSSQEWEIRTGRG